MLRAEGKMVPGSKKAYLFRRFYCIPCVVFLPSVGNMGWFTTALENYGTTAFAVIFHMRKLYRDKSHTAFVIIGATSVLSRTFRLACDCMAAHT